MADSDPTPLLARLRERQNQLVLALSTETSPTRLEDLSRELEHVLEQIQATNSGS